MFLNILLRIHHVSDSKCFWFEEAINVWVSRKVTKCIRAARAKVFLSKNCLKERSERKCICSKETPLRVGEFRSSRAVSIWRLQSCAAFIVARWGVSHFTGRVDMAIAKLRSFHLQIAKLDDSFFPKDDYLGVLKSIVCAGVRVCVCVCVSACEWLSHCRRRDGTVGRGGGVFGGGGGGKIVKKSPILFQVLFQVLFFF